MEIIPRISSGERVLRMGIYLRAYQVYRSQGRRFLLASLSPVLGTWYVVDILLTTQLRYRPKWYHHLSTVARFCYQNLALKP